MPPGSRVSAAPRRSASREAWVDLPDASPPSNTIRRPDTVADVRGVTGARSPIHSVPRRMPPVGSWRRAGGAARRFFVPAGLLSGGRLLPWPLFLAGAFLAAAFFGGAFFAAAFFLAGGPLLRRLLGRAGSLRFCSSSAARSMVIASGSSSLRSEALVSPSVTYRPKRPSFNTTGFSRHGSAPSSRSGGVDGATSAAFGLGEDRESLVERDA